MMRLSGLLRHPLMALVYGALGAALVLLVVFVPYLNERPDLSVWHLADLDQEFTSDSDVTTFADYLALEAIEEFCAGLARHAATVSWSVIEMAVTPCSAARSSNAAGFSAPSEQVLWVCRSQFMATRWRSGTGVHILSDRRGRRAGFQRRDPLATRAVKHYRPLFVGTSPTAPCRIRLLLEPDTHDHH